jgi:DNA-binding response OmpR family regulator
VPSDDDGPVRVLLVEDEPALASAIGRGLRSEGFTVEFAHDGVDGLWHAIEQPYDAVILDLLLPGMNGYEVCRRMRASKVWTPVLVLTAKQGEFDEADALDIGADDFLRKPFSFVVLAARLRAIARRGALPRPAVMELDDLTVDPSAREVRRGGRAIMLSGREYELLLALMRRAGTVVSKTELRELVWGSDIDGSDNLVEVYVGYLRRKVDAPFGRTTIRTVRGHGYVISADAT